VDHRSIAEKSEVRSQKSDCRSEVPPVLQQRGIAGNSQFSL
jgi:hypothetical protein